MGRKTMKKKAAAAASRAEKAKVEPTPNPFEVKTNRRKHQVIDNRKQKKHSFNQVESRTRGEQLRGRLQHLWFVPLDVGLQQAEVAPGD